MSDEIDFSDAMHYRASMIMPDFPVPSDLVPRNDKEGMLRNAESMDVNDALQNDMEGHGGSTRPEGPKRTPSVAFNQGEHEMVSKVLEEVDKTAAKRMREGMQETNFSAGVLNSFLMTYVFGAFPQHFWLLYLVEGCFLIPIKFLYMIRAKPLSEAFYYFDLCWFLNVFAIISLLGFVLSSKLDLNFDEGIRKEIYTAAVGAACGPLTGATIALPFVAFLFHDVGTMTGLFVHLYPPMVVYTLLWHADDIRVAWPTIFRLDYLNDITFFPESGPFFLPLTNLGSIASNSVALYFVWFMLYVLWQVLIGMDLPRKVRRTKLKDGSPAPAKYDTVFHSTVRGGLCITIGKVFWSRPKSVSLKQMEDNDFEMRDFAVYMGFHAVASVTSIYALGYICHTSKKVHMSLLLFLILITVHRGAKRYTYYTTIMYGHMIRKQFAKQVGAMDNESKKDR